MTGCPVERIVLIKLTESAATPDSRQAVAAETRRVFPTIPGVKSIHVAQADAADQGSWDLCLKVGFDHVDDVPGYRSHPIHVAYVDEYLKPKLDCLKAWNFVSV